MFDRVEGQYRVTQRARHVTWTLAERPERLRLLIRERDQKFTDRFDEVFRGDGIAIVCTPQANGVVGRLVRTARSECLDWMRILNQRHFELIAPCVQPVVFVFLPDTLLHCR
jgi:putative transposase